MKILILANNDIGLYQFRRELIEELIKKNEVMIALPYGGLVEPLKKIGCRFINTPVDRRGINPLKDLKLLKKYVDLMKAEAPELVITYTIKPNIYGGMACRIKKVPYAVNITGLGTAFQKKGFLRKLVTVLYRAGIKRAKRVFFENVEKIILELSQMGLEGLECIHKDHLEQEADSFMKMAQKLNLLITRGSDHH